MVTNHNFVTDVIDRMRQAYCGLHGHDSLLQFEQDRMFLKCTSCGHESPGWEIQEPPAAVSEPQAKRRSCVRRSSACAAWRSGIRRPI
jgi:hypothetical protein